MKRFLFSLLTLWVVLLGPGLCLTGVLEHLCADSPELVACGHEENCTEDPCSDILLRPVSDLDADRPAPVILCILPPAFEEPGLMRFLAIPPASDLPPGNNLPYPTSDLPLLI